ncbi:MAG: threonylcarbamoyl-AMP synthase [Gemmatimonadetes bacterium]|nr:threonylcarbamoyl-AMP synthase [Gemmatimonadota bacterium]MCC6770864.1 threonylcarbamoyl-AMP synthase [Gemmatimonadaceae bacterium]
MTPDLPAPLPRAPRTRQVDPADASAFDAAIAEGAEIIRAGGLVAFPTETVYGLGANALDAAAVARIYRAKGRPAFNPIIVHIADASALRLVAREVPPMAEALARAFWPGPLTLVLPRAPHLPDAVSAGLDAVGVRVPAHPVARALIERSGVPIAAPSANPYSRVSPTTAAHVIAQLGDAVDLVLDGGACRVGIESTVVDVTGPRPILLRPGGVSRDEVERVVGPVERPAVVATGDAPRPAPGMVDRHYAPQAQLVGFRAWQRAEVWGRIAAMVGSGRRVGVVAFNVAGSPATCPIAMPVDPEGYARALYATLHTLDREGCTVAFVEVLPTGGEWEAILDRLRRAGLDRSADG